MTGDQQVRPLRFPIGRDRGGDGDEDDEQIPLCRIEYLGDDEDWGFAIYDPAPRPTPRRCSAPGSPPGIPTTPSTPLPPSTSLIYQQ
jgi:hypothetical protein